MFVPTWAIVILVAVTLAAERYLSALRDKVSRMERLLRPTEPGGAIRPELERQRSEEIARELVPHWWP